MTNNTEALTFSSITAGGMVTNSPVDENAARAEMMELYRNLSDSLFFDPTAPPGAAGYALAAIGSLLLACVLLSGIVLQYITLRHGYGSVTLNLLVMNWALFAMTYGITHSGLNTIHQYLLRKWWSFGYPACVVSLFLENFCVLPLDALPTVICVCVFRKVFCNKAGRGDWIARVPNVIWVTSGLWTVVLFCTLGSIYEGQFLDLSSAWRLKALGLNASSSSYPIECVFGLPRNSHLRLHTIASVEMLMEIIFGALIPLVVMLIVGIKTIRRTWGTKGNIPSPLYGKVKVRQLIAALMGIMIIHYIWVLIEFIQSEVGPFSMFIPRTSVVMAAAAGLALVFCHEEFLRTLPCRGPVAEDRTAILPRLSFSKSQGEPQYAMNV